MRLLRQKLRRNTRNDGLNELKVKRTQKPDKPDKEVVRVERQQTANRTKGESEMKKVVIPAIILFLAVVSFASVSSIKRNSRIPSREVSTKDMLPEGVSILEPAPVVKFSPGIPGFKTMHKIHPARELSKSLIPQAEIIPKKTQEWWDYVVREGYVNPDRTMKYEPGEMVIEFKKEIRGKIANESIKGALHTGLGSVDELNIKFQANMMQRAIKEDLSQDSLALKNSLDLIYIITFSSESDMEEISDAYLEDPNVHLASPNYYPVPHDISVHNMEESNIFNIPQVGVPNDPNYDWAPEIMKSRQAWNLSHGSSSVKICHMAAGGRPNYAHTDLDRNWSGQSGGGGSITSHATACCGCMVAETNNSTGMAGEAGGWGTTEGVNFMYYNVTTVASHIAGLKWAADNGAIAINHSFSWLPNGNNPAGLEGAINYAWDHGSVIFSSSGNDGTQLIGYPPYYGNVIAVSASDASDHYCGWATHGDWVDVTAPGDAQWLIGYEGGASGTSFSSPRACGLAGLMKSYNSGWNNVTIRDNIERTADWLDYKNTGKEGLYGGGRLNAYEALMARNKNVSVNTILSPGDSVSPNFAVTPEVVVQNRGKQPESFLITCEIDTITGSNVYTDTKLVEDLQESYDRINKGRVLDFGDWTPGGGGAEYQITVYSRLVGDQNPVNDTLIDTIYVRTGASGTIDTLIYDTNAPSWFWSDVNYYWSVRCAPVQPCSLMSIIFYGYNNGTYHIYSWNDNSGLPGSIKTGPQDYNNTSNGWKTVNITGHPYFDTDFHLGYQCGAPPNNISDDGPATGHSHYSADGSSWSTDANYNYCIRAIVKYPPPPINDVMTNSIIVPSGHELTGKPIVPEAVIKNIGANGQSGFDVTFKADSSGINVLTSTKTISSLGPTVSDTISFDGWTPNWEGGTYNARVYTQLVGDENLSNDTAYVNVLCTSTDTISYDDNSPYWIYTDSNCHWAVTFYPQQACSVIGMDYMLYVGGVITDARKCTLSTYEAENDTPTTRFWVKGRASTVHGWNTYDFNSAEKINRPNAEDFALGIWTYGLQGGDTACPRFDNTDEPPYHSYANTGTGWGSPLIYDMFLRARVKYYGSLPNTDVALASLDEPEEYAFVHPDRPVTPKVTIKNAGTQDLTNINVICKIDTGTVNFYQDTVNVANLSVAYTNQVSFNDWTPTIVDADYSETVWAVVSGDGNHLNDTLSTMLYCRVVDVISYNEETWGSGIGADYNAVRFTPERPCSLVGALINIYGKNTPAWAQSCTLFCFKDTLTRPASRTYLDFESYIPNNIISSPQNGYEYRIRVDFSSAKMSAVVCSTDFWLSNYTQTNASAGSLYTTASEIDTLNPVGRSMSNNDRMADTSWSAPLWDIGGSKYAQGNWEIKALVRYYNWTGDNPAPPDVMVNKSSPNLNVWWNEVTQDIYGSPVIVNHYDYFRATTPDFVPGISNFIVGGQDTSYIDNNLLPDPNNYYYLAFAFDAYETKSNKSNMGYKFRKNLYWNASKTDKNWVSFPYNSEYTNASDITAEFSPGGSPIYKVTKRRPDQLYEDRVWIPGPNIWSGDFAIEKGAMYEISVDANTVVTLCGSNDPDYAVPLYWNATKTDKNWVSIPYNAVYANASDITAEFSPSGSPIYKITRRRTDQLYEDRVWLSGPNIWSGDFTITRGEGLEISVDQNTSWVPQVYTNSGAGLGPWAMAGKNLHASILYNTSFSTPDWTVEKNRIFSSAEDNIMKGAISEQSGGESHTLYGITKTPENSSVKFLCFLASRPEKAISESFVGSAAGMKGRIGFWMADIGNLPFEWKSKDVVTIIIGSETSNGCESHIGYYGVMSAILDGSVDPQKCVSSTLKRIPVPEVKLVGKEVTLSWDDVLDGNILAYSIYRSESGIEYEQRLNNEIIENTEFIDETVKKGKTYYYVLKLVFADGYESAYSSANSQAVTVTSGKFVEDEVALPTSYALIQNSPNPFGKRTEISYQLPERKNIMLVIYDISGRLVKTLVSKTQNPGYYNVIWDGKNSYGKEVGTNIYFYRLVAGNYVATRKMNLVR